MRKINKKHVTCLIAFAITTIILITAPVMALKKLQKVTEAESQMTVLSIWQIDSFEGGKGSRASYLQNIGTKFNKLSGSYVSVTSLTASAARENIKNGVVPDMISYGAGIYGIENCIFGNITYYNWCYGGYCFITLDENADFADISSTNTIINMGTDNLSGAAALLCGVENADYDAPTGAYVKLINGKYKYLLGTQRDIYRLITRGETFKILPITQFNDLYQNISITTSDLKKQVLAEQFISCLLSESSGISKLGLMYDNLTLHDGEMRNMEGIDYEITIKTPISENLHNQITSAISNSDKEKLKILLK